MMNPTTGISTGKPQKNRVYYEYYNLKMTEDAREDYTEIPSVCLRAKGNLELPAAIETACRTAARKVQKLEGFRIALKIKES